jgi:hypothetical protein
MDEPKWIHLTARMRPGTPDLTREDTGGWLWPRLRELYPEALAAELMPDHPHLATPSHDPDADMHRLAYLLGHFGRRFGMHGQASIVAPPKLLADRDKLARDIRYIALNPCRKRLAKCPLAWPWTTHRDVVGASVDPWVTADRLAVVLGQHPKGFAARHHKYVSGDPSASLSSTPFPIAVDRRTTPGVPLETILDAAIASLRVPRAAVRSRGPARALFVALAFDQGWTRVALLADACDCGQDAIRRLARGVDASALAAARLCLGDARLRWLASPAPGEV